ncbi:MAG: nucleoside triphosphate pyrophosphohydrolase [Halorhodospira halophila]|uniref:nucleoside triphosphate pyrophosphohydrolase n=1 Tax=Halorhodospira TaxID=85108 RepID=UPI0019114663|nr:nucleoside triphosphate pyrophosphohydrolase [Halorhodospira halophila]MCG5532009.1 nucleoside triphosphate pyrophosphohydrolase [Halorhodospira sp. 9621]MCG5538333.1 nucleoside triphosphate pyrophosphohydrolase [Halorhodospira sp. 9622]MCG5543897.1 nucleoside triphosphate pyrophosphohydrolase [Halorhodospira sp. 9628]MBK5937610.1 nucleoside triphosphate pyrophosphohydrolase [Halorhodospira halophila]MBK5942459.1 nucleoside triphosphate pyrophosphohydrolase [Halorhodospira halophila]
MQAVDRLLQIMERLRDPERGCPWDVEQDFHSIAPHTVEEAYEVFDAIERGDMDALRDELGDLLLQVVFHARMGEEGGHFDLESVAETLEAKLIRRHPHVFGAARVAEPESVTHHWEAIKEQEREHRGEGDSALDGVATALPALARATKLQRRAARVGFDWPDYRGAAAKIREELAEAEAEVDGSPERREAEVGDLLFAVVNLARHLDVDPETALRRAGQRFEARFRGVEAEFAARGETLGAQSIDALEAAWQRTKGREGGT